MSAGSLTLVTGQVFTIAVSDHASSSPPAGCCPGRASVRLACVCAGSGAAACLAATCPGSVSVRRHPRPGERGSCRSGGSQPLLAALTTLPVCLGFAPATQAGTRLPSSAASLSASTAPASFLAGGGSRLVADNRRPRHKKAAAVSLLRFIILRCAWMRICFGRCRRCAGHRPSIHRHGRCRLAVNRYRHHAAVASTITSHYVKLSAARLPLAALRARRVYITNVDRTCRLVWPSPATGFTLRRPARSGSYRSASLRAGSSPLFFLSAGFPHRAHAAWQKNMYIYTLTTL